MLRRLRVLAAFFMIPVVVMASPQAAAAAGTWTTVTTHSPTAPLLGDNIPGTIDTIDCTFSLLRTGDYSIDLGSKGSCYGIADVTPGWTQAGEAGAWFRIDLSGQTASGDTCSGSHTSTLGQHPDNGTLRVAGTITSGTIGVSAADCTVTRVCITHPSAGSEDCVTVSIPPLEVVEPPAGAACPHGFPAALTFKWVQRGPNPYNNNLTDFDYVGTYDMVGLAPVSTAVWQHSRYLLATSNPANSEATVNSNTFSFVHTSRSVNVSTSGLPLPIPRAEMPWGFEFFVQSEPINQYPSGSRRPATTVPDEAQDYFGGVTQPENCRWWFGRKLVDLANTEIDEPAADFDVPYSPPGPDEPEPEPDPDPVTPITDPPDEEMDWLGAIWALLKTIWGALVSGFQSVVGAVKAVASAILNGLESMFETVFVPRESHMRAEWQPVQDEWNTSTVSKYWQAATSFQTGSVSGCAGLPLNVTLPGDVAINQSIGAACSGPMATTAGVTRSVLTAVFLVGGAMACLRAVGSGLGWNPTTGRDGVGA